MKEALYIKFSMILFHFRNNHVHFLFKKCYHLVVKNTACFEIAGFGSSRPKTAKQTQKGRPLWTCLCINSQTIKRGFLQKTAHRLLKRRIGYAETIDQTADQTNEIL